MTVSKAMPNDISPSYQVGKHCIFCKADMELNDNRSKEDILAKSLFGYSKAIVGELTCEPCNNKIGGECESRFFWDEFIQHAKTAILTKIEKEGGKKPKWVLNPQVQTSAEKPGFKFIYGPDDQPLKLFYREIQQETWRAIGKAILCIIALNLGNKVFLPVFDDLRNFVLLGGNHSEVGLHNGSNKDGDWKEYHEIRIDVTDNRRFFVEIGLFGLYSFLYSTLEPFPDSEFKSVRLRLGVVERHHETDVIRKDKNKGEKLVASDKPIYISARFLMNRPKGKETN